ncbi:MAG TPA: DedA family protein [Planctomycetota bacterium]|nr:DedA family protein [Planctomycetota bacterium]
MHHLFVTILEWVRDGGYLAVALLMAMESSILPLPSEIVIPPAAYWASQGRMSLAGVVLAGTIGSYVGAMAMYAVSRWLGRPLVLRWGKYVRITPEKLERSERLLERYELGGVFFARLLPVVRHLIGIPAGVVRVRIIPYSIATIAGSAIWCAVLAWFGQHVLGSEPHLMDDPDAIVRVLHEKSSSIITGVLVLAGLYGLMLWMTGRRRRAKSG